MKVFLLQTYEILDQEFIFKPIQKLYTNKLLENSYKLNQTLTIYKKKIHQHLG